MKDLLGEKTALEQTQLIVAGIPKNSMPSKMYKKLVQTIYGNQLKKFTRYNRLQRHNLVKKLLSSSVRRIDKTPDMGGSTPLPRSKSASQQVSEKKQGETIAEQGGQ